MIEKAVEILQRRAYRPIASAPIDEIDVLVLFAFGRRRTPDGTIAPGPTNEAIARLGFRAVGNRPIPILAQREVAEALTVISGVIDPVSLGGELTARTPEGHLSTSAIAKEVLLWVNRQKSMNCRLGVIAWELHLSRAIDSLVELGLNPAPIEGINPPNEYDCHSLQRWTRHRLIFALHEISLALLRIFSRLTL